MLAGETSVAVQLGMKTEHRKASRTQNLQRSAERLAKMCRYCKLTNDSWKPEHLCALGSLESKR